MQNAPIETTNEIAIRVLLNHLAHLCLQLLHFLLLVCGTIYYIAERFVDEIIATEQMFLMMTNLYAFMCQFFFFTLCDIAILLPETNRKGGKVISGLTTLLLYSIITYFLSKIRETFYHTLDRSRNYGYAGDCLLRAIKVLLEFGKAAIVILCLKEQGLHYTFDKLYSTATFVYYACTEKLFIQVLVAITRAVNLNSLDGLEHLYVPIILHVLSITLTIIVVAYLLSCGKYTTYAVLSSYFTLYLPIKDMYWNYVEPLLLEQRTFASFKIADEKDISQWDDICAVCLERMSRARITPCNHLFHPHCLKRCLQTSMQCPLCKCDFARPQ